MHGKGLFEYASGDVLKSISIKEWKEGKKRGLFEDVVRVGSKQVYYDAEEARLGLSVKREAPWDEDTKNFEHAVPMKRRKVSLSSS